MNNKITWKIISIKTTSEDGVPLKGELKYWSKEYAVFLQEPFETKSVGYRLQYAVPVKYVINEAPQKGIAHLDVLSIAKKALLDLYQKGIKEQKWNKKD